MFKYENGWALEEECKNMVKEEWQTGRIDNSMEVVHVEENIVSE